MDSELAETYGRILKRRSESQVPMSDFGEVAVRDVVEGQGDPLRGDYGDPFVRSPPRPLKGPSRQLKPDWAPGMAGAGAGRWRAGGEESIILKVLVIGDPCVGKTSFVQRYVAGTFHRNYKGTIGVDFALKICRWTDSESGGPPGTVKVQLWDIAGQERYTSMTRVYYRDAHGCIVMFDLTNRNSFLNVVKWKRDLDAKCVTGEADPIPCLLIANKADVDGERSVTVEEIERLCKEFNFTSWSEVSVKENVMVEESMKFLIAAVLERSDEAEDKGERSANGSIRLNGAPHSDKQDKSRRSSCACSPTS